MTPEGKIKAKVKRVLTDPAIAPHIWVFMPVPNGYQAATLDYIGIVQHSDQDHPAPFFIETKRPGEKPTERQEEHIRDLRERLNAKVFVIDGDAGVEELRQWLNLVIP